MSDSYDVLVVGAGPAGLAAASAAASHGVRVALLDAQPRPGGQVWRHDVGGAAPRRARRAMTALGKVTCLSGHQVIDAKPGSLLVETADSARWLGYGALVMACGARELLLPFPGWTLPGVTGAGGLQALAKQGWPLTGKRVVVAGSGPLLLAVASALRSHGAAVIGIHEQAGRRALANFARQLPRWPGHSLQALTLGLKLVGVPYRNRSIVRRALGRERLEAVEISSANGIDRIACDYLACGYGLVPNVELATLLGCATGMDGRHPSVRVDALLRTSLDGVFAAGEMCGVAGLEAASIEGTMAGHAAAGATAAAARLKPARARARRFARLLRETFALDQSVHGLVEPDTLVCRCEDVSWGRLQPFTEMRDARLATRCGMGACQGRICGTALAERGHFSHPSIRPPLFPARLATLAAAGLPSPLDEVLPA